jgi:hypothetical protein
MVPAAIPAQRQRRFRCRKQKSGPCRAAANIAGAAAEVRSNQPILYAARTVPDRFPGQ